MITMTNVLKRGRTVWDRALLPEDEYVERVRVLRELMANEQLEALVSLGHATRPGNFTYLSGYVPPLGWMGTVLGRQAGPVLVSGGGSREIPFVRTQTWIDDLRTSRSLFTGPAEVVKVALEELAGSGSRIGLAGAHDALNPAARAELTDALSGFEIVEADALMRSARARKRPRELDALRQSAEIAREAVDAAVERWRAGATNAEALLEAEALGRRHGCRDVYVLGDLGGGALAPVENDAAGRADSFTAYCAVEHLGYWGQACASAGADAAAVGALDAMIAAVRAGARAGELERAARERLPAQSLELSLSYGLGGGIGLDPSEEPEVRADSGEQIPSGAVLALQVLTHDGDGVLQGAAETVLVNEGGSIRL